MEEVSVFQSRSNGVSYGPTGPNGVTFNPSSFWGPTGAAGPVESSLYEEFSEKRATTAVNRIKRNLKIIQEEKDENKIAEAKYDMAQSHRYGWAVPVNSEKSLSFYKAASNLGHAKAAYELARLYIQGNVLMGVEKDLQKAKEIIGNTLQKLKDKQSEDVKQLEALNKVVDVVRINSYRK
jgi:hypothetical protein